MRSSFQFEVWTYPLNHRVFNSTKRFNTFHTNIIQ
jgi:hypothetical protein